MGKTYYWENCAVPMRLPGNLIILQIITEKSTNHPEFPPIFRIWRSKEGENTIYQQDNEGRCKGSSTVLTVLDGFSSDVILCLNTSIFLSWKRNRDFPMGGKPSYWVQNCAFPMRDCQRNGENLILSLEQNWQLSHHKVIHIILQTDHFWGNKAPKNSN